MMNPNRIPSNVLLQFPKNAWISNAMMPYKRKSQNIASVNSVFASLLLHCGEHAHLPHHLACQKNLPEYLVHSSGEVDGIRSQDLGRL